MERLNASVPLFKTPLPASLLPFAPLPGIQQMPCLFCNSSPHVKLKLHLACSAASVATRQSFGKLERFAYSSLQGIMLSCKACHLSASQGNCRTSPPLHAPCASTACSVHSPSSTFKQRKSRWKVKGGPLAAHLLRPCNLLFCAEPTAREPHVSAEVCRPMYLELQTSSSLSQSRSKRGVLVTHGDKELAH